MFTIIAILSVLLPASVAYAEGCENYCLATRGNGEAVPATLTAMARMTEEFGMPRSMSGGSSATVAMFLQDMIAGNKTVKSEKDQIRQRRIQALMLKSMPEFMAVMAKDSKVADGFGMMQAMGGGDKELVKQALEAFKNAGSLSTLELQAALAKYGSLLNPELVALVQRDPVRFGPEAAKSVTNLGAFNAVTDDTLFFRPGLIDFKGFALVLGYMGDFYAGNTDEDTKQKFDGFLSECADKAYGKEWSNVPDQECKAKFQKIAADYLKAGKFQHKAVFQKVGVNSENVPTTSLLQGAGVTKYLKVKQDYENGRAEKIEDFSIDFKTDMSFGYWGKPSVLSAIEKGLAPYRQQGDLRAKKFRALGSANWFEVLSLSPAEPGIANCQKVPVGTTPAKVLAEFQKPIEKRWSGLTYRRDVLSCGGWSDLQPTAVERAKGCRPTIFLTRHADYGDSKFGQQIFIRLTGTKKQIPFWEKIGDGGPGGWCADKIRAQGGDPAVVADTPWSQISNLCNPGSSFRRALDLEDAVYCTDWDNANYNVFKGQMRSLIKEAYSSPLIPISKEGAACKLNQQPSQLDAKALPGCLPYPSPGARTEIPDGQAGSASEI